MKENFEKQERAIRKKYSPQFKDQALERAIKDSVPHLRQQKIWVYQNPRCIPGAQSNVRVVNLEQRNYSRQNLPSLNVMFIG